MKRPRIIRANSKTSAAVSKPIGPLSAPVQENAAGHAVKVNRNNGEVESIEVTCACGERILVRCDYAA